MAVPIRLDYKTVVEAIAQIEQTFDVNALQYQDLQVWPLIRLHIWWKLLPVLVGQSSSKLSSEENLDSDQVNSSQPSSHRIFHPQDLSDLKVNDSLDILFLSRGQDYTDQLENKFYNRHIDPLIELVQPHFSYVNVELLSTRTEVTTPRFISTNFIDSSSFIISDNWVSKQTKLREIERIQGGFPRLRRLINEKFPDIKVTEKSIIRIAQKIEQYYQLFEKILITLKPKVLMLVCYYSPMGMAAIRACRQLGITTVDIQHGKQGKYHGLYTHWTQIPDQGYEFLPDLFWCWGEESKENIVKWQPENCQQHQPIVGGNCWLAKWMDEQWKLTGQEQMFLNSLKGKQIVVLYSMQPDIEPEIPEFLLDAMQQSPEDWLWLVRLHPRQRERLTAIELLLKKNQIKNTELNLATHLPLYALLKNSHHHVTCWSSVCYEALAFNQPTTILHPHGYQLYEAYIQQGIFSYADNRETLLKSIKAGTTSVQEKVPYVQACREESLRTLSRIFNQISS